MIRYFKNLDTHSKALAIIIVYGFFQALYNALLPIYVDEAYYWVWALHPQLSYYDHPAMVAWIIWPFTLIGDSVFVVRLSTVICMSVAIWYLFKLAYEISGEKSAWYVLIIFMVLPAVQLGYLFITPDSPLIMFWAAAMYYTYRALESGKTSHFVIAGVLTGCAMVSKYAGILFPISVFIFILLRRRDLLLGWRLWLTVIVAALVTLPIFIWNYNNDWISIKFQYDHGTSSSFEFAGWDFVLLVLGSLMIPTPILSYILIKYIADIKSWFRNDSRLYLMVLTLFPLFFFFYKGFFKKMELNWRVIAFIAGGVLIGIAAKEYGIRRLFKWGVILAVGLSVILKLMPVLPLPGEYNVMDRLLGYKQAADRLNELVTPDDAVFSDHLTTASLLRFYLPDHRRVYIPVFSRMSQYTMWDNANGVDMYNKEGIFVGRNSKAGEMLRLFFNKVELIEEYKVKLYNSTEKTFYIYRVGGGRNELLPELKTP